MTRDRRFQRGLGRRGWPAPSLGLLLLLLRCLGAGCAVETL